MRARTKIVVAMVPCALATLAWWLGATATKARGAHERVEASRADDAHGAFPKCMFVTLNDGGAGIRCLPGYRPRTGLNAEPLDSGEGIPADVEIVPVEDDVSTDDPGFGQPAALPYPSKRTR